MDVPVLSSAFGGRNERPEAMAERMRGMAYIRPDCSPRAYGLPKDG
ncbi:MAG: hypothetical protein J7K45_04570 [Thaumarchaeota archaeon]|nr:hypothetical protein [Nitrososphaerota archaeon]